MPVWEQFHPWVLDHLDLLAVIVGVVLLACLIPAITALVKTRQLKERYDRLVMGRDGLNLEELLGHHGELIQEGLDRSQQADSRLEKVEAQLQLTVAGMSLVRYNAFRETGSDLSFSLALLDRNLDGVVLTSLFGRDESRCYGKPIKEGQSEHHLSEEERQVLEEAKRRLCEDDS